jgi:hypothetical protein
MRLLLPLLLVACSTTNGVAIRDARSLRTGGHRDVFDAGDARVGPNSKLRFCDQDGDCSDWIYASDLRVDDEGAWIGSSKSGYAWSDVAFVDVKTFDGLKTSGAIIGVTAAIAAVIPIVLLATVVRAGPRGDGVPVGARSYPEAAAAVGVASVAIDAATTTPPPTTAGDLGGYWAAHGRGAVVGEPRKLFTVGARVRSYLTLGAAVDLNAATEGNLVTSGAVARLRLGDFLELGAGARLARGKGEDGAWQNTHWYVAQGSFHAPVTARFAFPLGLDIAWGGDKALSNQVTMPLGIRYTGASGRWYGTLHPASLSWVKRDGDWKFGIVSGFELAVTL